MNPSCLLLDVSYYIQYTMYENELQVRKEPCHLKKQPHIWKNAD